NVYRNASIFCLSSHYEGFALVLLEAMAFGLPIVSTDCETGPTELIRNGENGMLVRAGDPRALADGLIEVIRDNNLANALASSARDVARRYTLDGIAKC
ncbi:MAG TPA: glycosyl transferase, partial [Cupriavidus sp.]|nr:glycosyl transferase [Cupriavidus sp.]